MIESVERKNQQVWRLNGITYLPHYTKPGMYVGPGWSMRNTNEMGETIYHPMQYTLLELISSGAVAGEMFLWPR
jgi:hypothetical protein